MMQLDYSQFKVPEPRAPKKPEETDPEARARSLGLLWTIEVDTCTKIGGQTLFSNKFMGQTVHMDFVTFFEIFCARNLDVEWIFMNNNPIQLGFAKWNHTKGLYEFFRRGDQERNAEVVEQRKVRFETVSQKVYRAIDAVCRFQERQRFDMDDSTTLIMEYITSYTPYLIHQRVYPKLPDGKVVRDYSGRLELFGHNSVR
jgi:hypothetical protein